MRISWLLVVAVVVARPTRAVCEDLDAPDPRDVTSSDTYDLQHEHFSLRLGGGVLVDYARYAQDDDSKALMLLNEESGIRDLRLLVSGRLPGDRLVYTVGYMLDVRPNEWRFRQTGIKLMLPELGGYLFVGRTKEGFSTNKLMVGYYGWFNERSAANDAFLPILGDGARWHAHAFGNKLVYNIGAFTDWISEDEPYNRNDWSVSARVVYLPFAGDESGRVLHLALDGRYAGANDGSLVFRSKPEAFLAQAQAVNTGEFPASRTTMGGAEAYYVDGPFSSGFEYYVNQVSSDEADDPLFHGGELFAAYLFTGETHPYKEEGGYFEDVTPSTSFFAGGPGAWELAARVTYVDLTSGAIDGGKFLRATALVNWYLTTTLRLEVAYGYGMLDREGLDGETHFFQTRFQLQVK